MESSQHEPKNQKGLWAFLEKTLWGWFSPDWTPQEPHPPETPQDHRDEMLNKCPWKDFW